MTNAIHDTSVPIGVYPDEFNLILKAINRAIDNKEGYFTENEVQRLLTFKDDFAGIALRHGV